MSRTLKAARAKVNTFRFGTPEWEAAMAEVRRLVEISNAARPAETFCSVDSGVHPTRLLDGRLIA